MHSTAPFPAYLPEGGGDISRHILPHTPYYIHGFMGLIVLLTIQKYAIIYI